MTPNSIEMSNLPGGTASVDRSRIVAWVQAGVIGTLLLLIYWPRLTAVAGRWNSDANWSHGWLVPLFSLYFLYTRRADIARTPATTCYPGLVLFVLSLAANIYFFVFQPFAYLEAFSLLGAILGVVLFLTGWPMLRIVWLPILFLFFALPIPEDKYVQLTMPLRMLTTQLSSLVLMLIPDIEVEVQGVVVDYFYRGRPGSLNVEEACAGMRLMMAFVTLGVAMAYVGTRPAWQRICMVIACVPIAVFCNIVRVTTTGFLHVYDRRDLAQGTTHELLGMAMLPIALGLFALTGYVLKHLFMDEPTSEAGEVSKATEST
ncbi:MAG: exosortase/archaeosortase family protein [bacterium]|nr:exosortase/archaeosortase family protein [bacterium]